MKLTEEQAELGAALDFAAEAPTFAELIARTPKIPGDDDRLLPPALRQKYDRYLMALATKTFTG
jgi:hypothetical protein